MQYAGVYSKAPWQSIRDMGISITDLTQVKRFRLLNFDNMNLAHPTQDAHMKMKKINSGKLRAIGYDVRTRVLQYIQREMV